ncbi:MAG: dienelactone hydrolase family protein [Acidisphaera sp.]|nr:dienelactone hydrolase family protein [Acidisphaera sp.]
MRSLAGAFLALLTACAAPATGSPTFDTAHIGGPSDFGAVARLYRPRSDEPAPAMVVLHGCAGIGAHEQQWGQRLADWGYVALLVDSFAPRGVANVCSHGQTIPPLLRAADAYAAAAWLRTQPYVRADRIGVIGFSHGGWTVMRAVLESTVQSDHAVPFKAAVAFYPGCPPSPSPLATDTLILIGDADDWTPYEPCVRFQQNLVGNGHTLAMKIYPGALHSFDSELPSRLYMGHHLGHDPVASADAIAATREFLAARLRGAS